MKGVNFFGSWETSDGIGRASSVNIRALQEAGIKCDTYILSRPVALQSGRDTKIDKELIASLRYDVNIFHFSARWVPHFFSNITKEDLKGFYNIGYWVCEVPDLPDSWASQLKYFNEIWTASSFCQTAISKVASVPVNVFHHPVSVRDINKINDKRNKLRFTTIFNVYSDSERKNILFSIKAFLDAFSENENENEDVEYIIKVSNIEYDKELENVLNSLSESYSKIKVITGYVDDADISDIYNMTDVYVSLHRAEGFGFTLADAIARGIPVITTGYSGNMDFCLVGEVRLVEYELVCIGHERLRYRSFDLWAEPDYVDSVKAFKEMYDDFDSWKLRAMKARETLSKKLSFETVGIAMSKRLEIIGKDFVFNEQVDSDSPKIVGIKNRYGL